MVDRDKLKEINFVNEFMNSYAAIFTRSDGTIISTNSIKGVVTNTEETLKLVGIGGMTFSKGVFTLITLNEIVGMGFGKSFRNFSYSEIIGDRFYGRKAFGIYDCGRFIANVVIYYLDTDFKKIGFGNDLINDLVNCISKEYVYKLSDGRVIMGVDVRKYDTRDIKHYLYKRCKELNGFENNLELKGHDCNETVAFVIGADNTVDLGFMNSRTGDYLAWIENITSVLEPEKIRALLNKKKEYFQALDRVETAINKVVWEGRFI